MARSRNLKPSFFTNDKLAEVMPLGRLLFAGLWTLADREGRLEDRPKRIKAEILPYDDDANPDDLLRSLHEHGFILRYEDAGVRFIQVLAFSKHQDPHYKEKASVIPAPPGYANSPVTPGGVPDAVRQSVFDRDGRACKECGAVDDLSIDHIVPRSKGGTHDEVNLQTLCRRCNSAKNNRQAKANDEPIIGQPSANDPPDRSPLIPDSGFLTPDSRRAAPRKLDAPTEDHERIASEQGVSCLVEFQKYRDWISANGRRQRDESAGFRNWLRKAGDFKARDAPKVTAADRRADVADQMYRRGKYAATSTDERDITSTAERLD